MIRAKIYPLMIETVHVGVLRGLRRYYKHRDGCPEEAELVLMADAVESAVMGEMCEVFEFDEREE